MFCLQTWHRLPRRSKFLLIYAAAVATLAQSQVGPGLQGGREEKVQSHQLFPLTKARNAVLSLSAFCTVKSFRHKGLLQETRVREKRDLFENGESEQGLGLPALIALLGPGTSPEGWGGAALQVTGCESGD
jgi:hypothetical protein